MFGKLRLSFAALRVAWLTRHLDAETAAVCRRNDIPIPSPVEGDGESWGDWRWHLRQRLHGSQGQAFLVTLPQFEGQEEKLAEYLKSFDFSLLPLNSLLPEGIQKFLPRLDLMHRTDPYGVQKAESVVTTDGGEKRFYLATHKSHYATLLPILGSSDAHVTCPIGCAGCHRACQTRLRGAFKIRRVDGTEELVWFPQPAEQLRLLVDEWNTRPELAGVYDLLVSGGEPMLQSNATWTKMLEHLKDAEHLRCLRICTGTLFLGLPWRFDEEFIELLKNFRRETGVVIKISCHVSHPDYVTPEALMFARRLRLADIELLPQIPLEEGVNFWVNNPDRSAETVGRLAQLVGLAANSRPYKLMVDMQGTVPLLSAIELWRRLFAGHQGEGNIVRPTAFELFRSEPEGNVELSYHSLWALSARIEGDEVVYIIPHPTGRRLEHREPLLPGVNDPERLVALRA